MKKQLGFAMTLVMIIGGATAAVALDDPAYGEVDPNEAFGMVTGGDGAFILDIRTPSEWHWVGHPAVGVDESSELDGKVLHVPWRVWRYAPLMEEWRMMPNSYFAKEMVALFNPGDEVILMDRNMDRSLEAVAYLTNPVMFSEQMWVKLESLHLYVMTEGFEGAPSETTSGWVGWGLPYNRDLDGIWVPPFRRRAHILQPPDRPRRD